MRDARLQKPRVVFPAGPSPPLHRYLCTCSFSLREIVIARARRDAELSPAERSSSGFSTAVQCCRLLGKRNSSVPKRFHGASKTTCFICPFGCLGGFHQVLKMIVLWGPQNCQKCCIAGWSISVCIGSSPPVQLKIPALPPRCNHSPGVRCMPGSENSS